MFYWLSQIYWCIRKGFPLRSLISCDLCYYKLPTSTTIPHPYGITISNNTNVGENVFISPNVTIGVKRIIYKNSRWDAGGSPSPTIGNDVFIGAGAVLLGNIIIADGCIIGAGSIVIESVLETGTVIIGKVL
jgi:serine O-acetyltransferase